MPNERPTPPEPPKRVSVLLDDSAPSAVAPDPIIGGPARWPVVAAVAIGLALVALLWWTVGSSDETVDDEASPVVAPLLPDDQVVQAPLGTLINSATNDGSRWVALRRALSGSKLVESTDGLVWTEIDSEFATSNLFGLDRVDDEWRTMVNSSSLGEQRFTLLTQASSDAKQWERHAGAEPQSASGNQPIGVDLRFGNSVVVGDQPLNPTEPPAPLVALLSSYVSSDLASQTCSIATIADVEGGFELLSCSGEPLGRISTTDRSERNALSASAFLLQFEAVVMVQLDGQPVERLILPPGDQVASIHATPDGFLALVIGTLDGLDVDTATLGPPSAKLVRWTAEEGLVDVPAGFTPTIDLVAWFENSLEVTATGDAILATPSTVFRAPAPYEQWDVVLTPPAGASRASSLHIGPDGSGVVFADDLTRVWFGRVGGGWVRTPQLDGDIPRGVLLSTDSHVVAILEANGSRLSAVQVPLPAPAAISENTEEG